VGNRKSTCNGQGKICLTRLRSLVLVILSAIVPVVAVLITWLTQYQLDGFPLQWRTVGVACQALGCPPATNKYDWTLFTLDVLFYSAIGYGLLLSYTMYHVSKPAGLTPRPN
jgi:hypothetical protein